MKVMTGTHSKIINEYIKCLCTLRKLVPEKYFEMDFDELKKSSPKEYKKYQDDVLDFTLEFMTKHDHDEEAMGEEARKYFLRNKNLSHLLD